MIINNHVSNHYRDCCYVYIHRIKVLDKRLHHWKWEIGEPQPLESLPEHLLYLLKKQGYVNIYNNSFLLNTIPEKYLINLFEDSLKNPFLKNNPNIIALCSVV